MASLFATFVQMPGTGRLGGAQVPLLEDHDTVNTTEYEILVPDGLGGVTYIERFGSFYQIETDDTLVNTAVLEPTFTNYLTMTTPNLPAGDYMISWSYNVRHSATNNDWAVSVDVVGLDALTLNNQNAPGFDAEQPADASLNQAAPRHGERLVSWAAGVHTVVLEFSNQTGGNTDIKRGELVMWRVRS